MKSIQTIASVSDSDLLNNAIKTSENENNAIKTAKSKSNDEDAPLLNVGYMGILILLVFVVAILLLLYFFYQYMSKQTYLKTNLIHI